MARKNPRLLPQTPLDDLRRMCAGMEAAMNAAPPDKGAALAARLLPMAQRLETAWQKEQARRAPEDLREDARRSALRMRALDEEVARLIEERAEELVALRLTPSDWEMQQRAESLARMKGGAWVDHLPGVQADQHAYVARLMGLEPEPEPEPAPAEPAGGETEGA